MNNFQNKKYFMSLRLAKKNELICRFVSIQLNSSIVFAFLVNWLGAERVGFTRNEIRLGSGRSQRKW